MSDATLIFVVAWLMGAITVGCWWFSVKMWRQIRATQDVATLETELEAMEHYVALLDAELAELVPLAYVHGWRSSRADEGERLRAIIAAGQEETKE